VRRRELGRTLRNPLFLRVSNQEAQDPSLSIPRQFSTNQPSHGCARQTPGSSSRPRCRRLVSAWKRSEGEEGTTPARACPAAGATDGPRHVDRRRPGRARAHSRRGGAPGLQAVRRPAGAGMEPRPSQPRGDGTPRGVDPQPPRADRGPRGEGTTPRGHTGTLRAELLGLQVGPQRQRQGAQGLPDRVRSGAHVRRPDQCPPIHLPGGPACPRRVRRAARRSGPQVLGVPRARARRCPVGSQAQRSGIPGQHRPTLLGVAGEPEEAGFRLATLSELEAIHKRQLRAPADEARQWRVRSI
jgi:hypothetical protein